MRVFAAQTLISIILAAIFYFGLGLQSPIHGDDFVQDYVSAWAMQHHAHPYDPHGALRAAAGVPFDERVVVVTNPHPPGAVILTLPFVWLGHIDQAMYGLEWAQLVFLALAWNWLRLLHAAPVSGWLWAGLGGVLAFWAPIWEGIQIGHPCGLLALFATAIWWAAQREHAGAFGGLLGFACLVRPFFAIGCVVAGGWSSRRIALAALFTLLTVAVLFAVVGITPWHWFALSRSAAYYIERSGSLPGMLGLGTLGAIALYSVAAAGLLVARWRGLRTEDTLAIGAVLALIFYPLAWYFYDSALVPVLAYIMSRTITQDTFATRFARYATLVFFLLRAIPMTYIDPTASGGWVGWWDATMFERQLFARCVLLVGVIVLSQSHAPSVNENAPI